MKVPLNGFDLKVMVDFIRLDPIALTLTRFEYCFNFPGCVMCMVKNRNPLETEYSDHVKLLLSVVQHLAELEEKAQTSFTFMLNKLLNILLI